MLIGVDLDSVIASLRKPLVDFHNEKYKTQLKPSDIKEYDLTIVWNCSHQEKIERIFEFYKSPYMDEIKPMWGSKSAINKISKNHELIIITSRPKWIMDITETWVERYFPNKFEKVIHTNQVSTETEEKMSKSEVCRKFNVNLMIEDHIDYANDCATNGINVLLYSRPWNEKSILHPNIRRVHKWRDVVKTLEKEA